MSAALQQAEHAERWNAQRDGQRRIVLVDVRREDVTAAVCEGRSGDRAELLLDVLPLRVDELRRSPEAELGAPVRQVALARQAVELDRRRTVRHLEERAALRNVIA